MEDQSLFVTAILPVALAVIMLSLGLSLTPADFRRVVVFPRGVAVGITNLLVISPLLAFGVAELFGLAPAIAVGLVILGASPGGIMANMLVHLARGETALSITLTAISSVAAVITVPLFLELSTEHFNATGFEEDPSMAGIVARVLLITVVPLSIGMYLRQRSPVRVIAAEPRVKRASFAIFVLVVAGAIASEHDLVLENFTEVAVATLTLNVAAMAISFAISRLARLGPRRSTAIAIELGIHNSALTIAVGATISTELTVAAAVYSVFMWFTAGAFARAMYRRNTLAVEGADAPLGTEASRPGVAG